MSSLVRDLFSSGVILVCALTACSSTPGPSTCTDVDLGADLGQACVIRPAAAAARTECGAVDSFCDSSGVTTPNLACLATPATAAPTSTKIGMSGFVDVFATGPDTTDVTIQVFLAATLLGGADPTMLTPISQTTATFYDGAAPCPAQNPDDPTHDCPLANPTTLLACDLDATLGCVTPVTTGCATDCADGLNGRRDKQEYCRPTTDGAGLCRPRGRWQVRYTLTGVPSDEQIAMRVTGTGGLPDTRWGSTVSFGVIASTTQLCASLAATDCYDATTSTYRRDVVAISQVDYVAMPQRAGLLGGISLGRGALVGEVHDCDGVRIGNAQIAIAPEAERYTYFSDGIPAVPVPDATRAALGTSGSGLYAAFNLPPGAATVVPQGFLATGGDLQGLGAQTVRIYANTVTLLDIAGGRLLAPVN